MSFISCLSVVLQHTLDMKCYLFKGSLSQQELEKNLHNIATINSKFYINIWLNILHQYWDVLVFTPENCAFEASYWAAVLLLLSLKERVLLVFLTNDTLITMSKEVSLYFRVTSELYLINRRFIQLVATENKKYRSCINTFSQDPFKPLMFILMIHCVQKLLAFMPLF